MYLDEERKSFDTIKEYASRENLPSHQNVSKELNISQDNVSQENLTKISKGSDKSSISGGSSSLSVSKTQAI